MEFAFIGDINIAEGDLTMAQITIEEVYISMKKAINRWEGGLKFTGGAIRTDKPFVYPIY